MKSFLFCSFPLPTLTSQGIPQLELTLSCHSLPFSDRKMGSKEGSCSEEDREQIFDSISDRGCMCALGLYQESGLGIPLELQVIVFKYAEIQISVASLQDSGSRFVLFGEKVISPWNLFFYYKQLQITESTVCTSRIFKEQVTKGKTDSSFRTEKKLWVSYFHHLLGKCQTFRSKSRLSPLISAPDGHSPHPI